LSIGLAKIFFFDFARLGLDKSATKQNGNGILARAWYYRYRIRKEDWE
jgi:hypothetical protein